MQTTTVSVAQLPLAASRPPLGCRVFIAWSHLISLCILGNNALVMRVLEVGYQSHYHTPPGVRYYCLCQYNSDIPVTAPEKSFI